MKTYLHIICLLLLGLACACSDDAPVSVGDGVTLDGDMLTIDASVDIPDAVTVDTRALGTVADLGQLHLYLIEFADAGDPAINPLTNVYEAREETLSGDEVKFKVTIKNTSEGRILHLVALPKGIKPDVVYGPEAAVMTSITTGEGTDAYWRRLTYPNGYSRATATGEIVPVENLKSSLTRVPLVRNFARIDVRTTLPASEFQVLGFKVMTTPVQGCVAPWNASTHSFPEFLDADGKPRPYEELMQEYGGFIPGDTFFENQIAGGDFTVPDDLSPKYIYETPVSRDHTMCIIVKANWRGQGVCYYKLDLGKRQDSGVFVKYPVLRNYQYRLTITRAAAKGAASTQAAANGSTSNNLSFDFDTENLIKISDGTEVVEVSHATILITDDKAQTLTFQYRYTSASNANQILNTGVNVLDLVPGEVISKVSEPTVTKDGWVQYQLTLRPAQAEAKMQRFIVVKPSNGVGRTITLISHSPWTYNNLVIVPGEHVNWSDKMTKGKVLNTVGARCTLFFDLPDDLPSSIFPMRFTLEAKGQNLENYFVGNMEVVTDDSHWPHTISGIKQPVQVIKFVKEVTWPNYNAEYNPATDKQNSKNAVLMMDSTTKKMVHRVTCRMEVTRALTLTGGTATNIIYMEEPNYSPREFEFQMVKSL